MTARVADKARRLLADGAVLLTHDQARVYTVDGDHSRYVVVISPTVQVCTCPSQTRCSHIEAAVELERATGPKLTGYLAAIADRAERDAKAADDAFARLA
jgi:hypothetical protein